jgi:hypothetical protein
MEITKGLQRHALQVLVVMVAVLVISLITIGQYRTSDNHIWQGLVTQVIRIEPTANGLGKVSLNPELKTNTQAKPLQAIEAAGRGAQLTLGLQP